MSIIANWTLDAVLGNCTKMGFSKETNKVTGKEFTAIRAEHKVMGPIFINLSQKLADSGAELTREWLKANADDLQVVQRDDAPANVLSICKKGQEFMAGTTAFVW